MLSLLAPLVGFLNLLEGSGDITSAVFKAHAWFTGMLNFNVFSCQIVHSFDMLNYVSCATTITFSPAPLLVGMGLVIQTCSWWRVSIMCITTYNNPPFLENYCWSASFDLPASANTSLGTVGHLSSLQRNSHGRFNNLYGKPFILVVQGNPNVDMIASPATTMRFWQAAYIMVFTNF